MTSFDRTLFRFKCAIVFFVLGATFYIGVQIYLLATGRR